MKKYIITALLLAMSVISYATEIVTYSVGGFRELTIEADFNSDGEIYVSMETVAQSVNESIYIIVTGEENIRKFHQCFTTIRDKYSEWSDIAVRNNVSEFSKLLEIEFPEVQMRWWLDRLWIDSNKVIIAPPHFSISEENGTTMYIMGVATAEILGQEIGNTSQMIFKSTEELNIIVDALDYDMIKKVMDESKRIDDLFK